MKTITAPTLIMTGDEDWPCIEPGVLMKKNIPTAALVVMPNAGHSINLEEPAVFNAPPRRAVPCRRCRPLAARATRARWRDRFSESRRDQIAL